MAAESPDVAAPIDGAASENPTESSYTCARCGVVSAERTCFHFPAKHAAGPRDIRCLTCEMEWQRRRLPRRALFMGLNLALIVGVFLHGAGQSVGGIILTWAECVLLLPVILAIHEAGHMLVARLLGMDVGCLVVGVGPPLWECEIGGIQVQVNLLPLFGHVSLGLATEAFARLRLWLAILAGPAANLCVMWLSAHYWSTTSMLLGERGTMFWVFLNGLVGIGNLFPFRSNQQGQPVRSDGLGLIQIPRQPWAQLRRYLANASISRALHRYRRRNYAGARSDCLLALSRDPANDTARCLLSSCLARENLFDESRKALAPVLDRGAVPILLAWAKLNAAAAMMLDDDAQSEATADRLSKEAYEAFPCLVGFRTDRALILTWIGDPEGALAILDYEHFESAPAAERGERACGQALAFLLLGRTADADRHMAVARALEAVQLDLVEKVVLASNARRLRGP